VTTDSSIQSRIKIPGNSRARLADNQHTVRVVNFLTSIAPKTGHTPTHRFFWQLDRNQTANASAKADKPLKIFN
jgi:hypothetical protein